MNGADIQIEDGGYVRIHRVILERLAQTELTGRESRIVFALLRLTYGYNKKEDAIALSLFCDATNMKKANVSVTLQRLVDRKIIKRTETGKGRGHIAIYGFNKYWEQWRDAPVKPKGDAETDERLSLKVTPVDNLSEPIKVIPNVNKGYPKRTKKVIPDHEHTIDSINKDIKAKTNSAADAACVPVTHPAILVFDELKFARPPKRLLHLIEDAGITDIDLWRCVVRTWMGHDYKPTNVTGMLDWYHEPARFQRNNNYANGKQPPGALGARESNISYNLRQAQSLMQRFRGETP